MTQRLWVTSLQLCQEDEKFKSDEEVVQELERGYTISFLGHFFNGHNSYLSEQNLLERERCPLWPLKGAGGGSGSSTEMCLARQCKGGQWHQTPPGGWVQLLASPAKSTLIALPSESERITELEKASRVPTPNPSFYWWENRLREQSNLLEATQLTCDRASTRSQISRLLIRVSFHSRIVLSISQKIRTQLCSKLWMQDWGVDYLSSRCLMSETLSHRETYRKWTI